MKFWQKIFAYSLILFLIIFNLGGIFLIENSHNLSLQREVERGLSEHLSIYSGVHVIIKNRVFYSKNFSTGVLYVTIQSFLKSFNDENVYVEILDMNNNKLFSSLNIDAKDREELKNPLLDRRKYIIRDIGDKTYLFITNLLKVDEEYLKFSYIRDITYLYEDRKKQYYFFLRLNIIVSIVLAFGMYLLSKFITKPINNLIHSTQLIAKGNFSERVSIDSKDEIGILSENFNKMTCAVEDKVHQLEKSALEKQRFIDNLTHEIKTPLTSIIGYADFLRSTKYNEAVFLKGLNYIFKEGKRVEKLSSTMMNLILLKRDNFVMKKESMKNILFEIKGSLSPNLKNKNIDLVIGGEDTYILVEKDLIKNLLLNLIDNAIKASHEGSKIYLNMYKNKDLQRIVEIKDEGIGILKEDVSKIFEPFYMVDQSRTRENNGAGLGLSICSEIAKIHKAKLEIQSTVNKGTSVKIIFS